MDENHIKSALSRVEADWTGCQDCRLAAKRQTQVWGRVVGHLEQQGLMMVGEAPGKEEDQTGLAFVGKAGRMLDDLLESVRIQNTYITNPVCCRPPHNRAPEMDELIACLGRLQRVVEILAPKVIVPLGKIAIQWLLDGRLQEKNRIGAVVGQVYGLRFAGRETLVVPTYHPSYLLRQKRARPKVLDDLELAMALLEV